MRYEIILWIGGLLESIPGRIGCFVRNFLLPYKHGTKVTVWDRVHIDHPSRLRLGSRVSVNRGSVINAAGGIDIGDDVMIGPGVVIYTQNHRYERVDIPMNEQGYDVAGVVIENDVWIAARAIVLPGVVIGAGTVVAAGAVVTKSHEAGSVLAGVPARVIGSRG